MSSHSTPMGESGAALRNASVAGSSRRDRPTSRPWTRSPRAARSRSRRARNRRRVEELAVGHEQNVRVGELRAALLAALDRRDRPTKRADDVGAAAEAALEEVQQPVDVRRRRSDARTPDLGQLVRRAEGQHQPLRFCAAATRHAASATAFATASRPPAME